MIFKYNKWACPSLETETNHFVLYTLMKTSAERFILQLWKIINIIMETVHLVKNYVKFILSDWSFSFDISSKKMKHCLNVRSGFKSHRGGFYISLSVGWTCWQYQLYQHNLSRLHKTLVFYIALKEKHVAAKVFFQSF